MPELWQHWWIGPTWIWPTSKTTWPTWRKWGSLHPATPGLLCCCTTRSTDVGMWQHISAGVWILNTCPLSSWRKSHQHLAKPHFQSNTPLLANSWVLWAKKSVSSSTQGNAHMVESETLNMCAQCASRPTPSVTTACCKPLPSKTRMGSYQQIR